MEARSPENRSTARTTPYSKLNPSKLHAAFKSPMRTASKPNTLPDVEQLRAECRRLDDRISELEKEGHSESVLDVHIEKLHEYNETKDMAQVILGRLAELRQVTVRSIHEAYDLPTEGE